MNRRLAVSLLWGLVTWNGLSLVGFVTGLAIAPIAAPLGLVTALAVAAVAGPPRAAPSHSNTHELDLGQL